ncbi:hypothetical protein NX10_20470 [Pseudomonas fluorescens]|nr:hypothetical protein NX10_20470 [Pseudomonas fluorescens]
MLVKHRPYKRIKWNIYNKPFNRFITINYFPERMLRSEYRERSIQCRKPLPDEYTYIPVLKYIHSLRHYLDSYFLANPRISVAIDIAIKICIRKCWRPKRGGESVDDCQLTLGRFIRVTIPSQKHIINFGNTVFYHMLCCEIEFELWLIVDVGISVVENFRCFRALLPINIKLRVVFIFSWKRFLWKICPARYSPFRPVNQNIWRHVAVRV